MIDAKALAEILMVRAHTEEHDMNTNNYTAHRASIKFGKPITRKTVDVSQRKFDCNQLVRYGEGQQKGTAKPL